MRMDRHGEDGSKRDLKGQQVPGVQSACEHEVVECDGVTSYDFVPRCQMDGLWVVEVSLGR